MDNSRTNRLCVNVGGVLIGGGHPVAVQSMTNTDTADIAATVAQISALARAGSELVRITVNDRDAASAVPRIKDALMAANVDVPLVGDFHFNGHKLLAEHAGCAESLSKYRVNPGNVGKGASRHTQFARLVEIACKHDKVIRIGVNWGSLDPTMIERIMDENAKLTVPGSANDVMREAMVMSAIESAELAKSVGLPADHIVLSCKVSGVQDLVAIYRDLADRCNYPLHLGLTEAGMGTKGVVASTAALAILLQEGIGDTIRVSLTPEPGGDRTQEVVVAQQILQTMGIRSYTPFVVACPGCGRTTSTVFQHLAKDIESHIKLRMPEWKQKYVGVESMTIAVMGCVVNGPGESKHANIGISLPGTGEEPTAPVYVDGARTVTLKGDSLATQFAEIVDQYVDGKFRKKD